MSAQTHIVYVGAWLIWRRRIVTLMKESCWSSKLPSIAACVSFQPACRQDYLQVASRRTRPALAWGTGPLRFAGRQIRVIGTSLGP